MKRSRACSRERWLRAIVLSRHPRDLLVRSGLCRVQHPFDEIVLAVVVGGEVCDPAGKDGVLDSDVFGRQGRIGTVTIAEVMLVGDLREF